MSSSSWHHLSQIRLSAATARQVGAMEMSPKSISIYIYNIYLSLSLLPDVKIIHYFLRLKPYFNFEIKKSTQRPTKYYNSARNVNSSGINPRDTSRQLTSMYHLNPNLC